MTENSPQKRILLVEDNPSDVFLLRRALDEYGVNCSLHVVSDGEGAMQHLARVDAGEELPPDLIVLDLNLPRYDGIEVLTSCRRSPKLSELPVLVLTSSDSPMERHRAEELGVSDYVRKPLMLDDFMAVGGHIKTLLEGRSAAT